VGSAGVGKPDSVEIEDQDDGERTVVILIASIPLLAEQIRVGSGDQGQEVGNSDHRPDGNGLRSQKTHSPLWSRFQPI
jgi:hypothetical protein